MGDHGHDHAEHEHKHGDGCCGHDHGHAEPADSHEHSHAAPAEEKPSLPERWLSPKQRKGIGRYLKPWGKQPTSATFWIQILTTVAVIIISIAKGADATVALVISTGPAEFQERQNPQFLALGIVTCLFTVVFVAGYIMIKWQRARLEKQAEREAKEAKEAAEAAASKGVQEAAPAGAQEAGSKAEAAPAKAPGKKAARTKASLEIEQREQEEALAQLQAGLESALQQTLASAEADGCKPAETRRRVWAVQQEFADRTQLAKEIHEIINAATVEGCTEDAKKQRCDMHASFFQEMMQMKAHQAQELKAIEQASDWERHARARARTHCTISPTSNTATSATCERAPSGRRFGAGPARRPRFASVRASGVDQGRVLAPGDPAAARLSQEGPGAGVRRPARARRHHREGAHPSEQASARRSPRDLPGSHPRPNHRRPVSRGAGRI